jgi:sporulation protein YqfC
MSGYFSSVFFFNKTHKVVKRVEGHMFIKDELIYDFSINMPRILVGGRTAILDNVKKIVLISENNVVVSCGSRYISINGIKLIVRQLAEERMLISGDIHAIEFYGSTE